MRLICPYAAQGYHGRHMAKCYSWRKYDICPRENGWYITRWEYAAGDIEVGRAPTIAAAKKLIREDEHRRIEEIREDFERFKQRLSGRRR